MNIEYLYPLNKAWRHTKNILFQPFNLSQWLGIGLTAFLATLFEGGGGSGGKGFAGDNFKSWKEVRHFPMTAWEWLQANPMYAALILFAFVLFTVFVVFCTWLNSRGKFMFLDNVIHNRSEVTRPWNDFKTRGNSLFKWRLIFGLISLVVFGVFFILSFEMLYDIWMTYDSGELMILPAIIMGLIFLLLIMITLAVSWLLNDFIVPVMYKNNCSTTRAWSRFLPLFFNNILCFILYGLLLWAIKFVAFILVLVVGFSTCCIGFFLLLAPYISSVVTLPYSVTLRAFSLEFLSQFGPGYKLFPEPKPTVMV